MERPSFILEDTSPDQKPLPTMPKSYFETNGAVLDLSKVAVIHMTHEEKFLVAFSGLENSYTFPSSIREEMVKAFKDYKDLY